MRDICGADGLSKHQIILLHPKTVIFRNCYMQAQVWVKGMVAAAIRRCPGRAAVVFDNAHVLKGDDVLLLDPLLLLFDDSRQVLTLFCGGSGVHSRFEPNTVIFHFHEHNTIHLYAVTQIRYSSVL